MTPPEGNRSRKRLLLISYAYPPVGGAGVQRPLKFSKYLPSFGWDVTVLTVSNPSVPVLDPSLLDEIPNAVTVLRAKTWEPPYRAKQAVSGSARTSRTGWLPWIKRQIRHVASQWLVPDPQILWNRQAYQAGCRYANQVPHHAILVSGPPFSSFLLGEQLAHRLALPLFLDFRDEWMLSIRHLENHRHGQRGFQQQRRLFDRVLRSARGVLATTKRSEESLRLAMHAAGGSGLTATIYNGFDPDDLASHPQTSAAIKSLDPGNALHLSLADPTVTPYPLSNAANPPPDPSLQLLYMGTLWELTDATTCVDGLTRLARHSPELARRLSLKWIGRRTPEQQRILQQLDASQFAELAIHDYLPHDQALTQARQADILLLILADREGADRVVPGKLFEYFALGKTILAIVPNGECRDLMLEQAQQCPSLEHGCFTPDDLEGIVHWLQRQIRQFDRKAIQRKLTHQNGVALVNPEAWYARPQQAKQLAELLDRWSDHPLPLARAG